MTLSFRISKAGGTAWRKSRMDPAERIAQLEAENAELRRELEDYWRAYHAENCTHGDEWPHEGKCGYEPPSALSASLGGSQ